jgi:hypothetical protein
LQRVRDGACTHPFTKQPAFFWRFGAGNCRYEADAQLAHLSDSGNCYAIISEDSDLIVFGCRKVIYKLDENGDGSLYDRRYLGARLGQSKVGV